MLCFCRNFSLPSTKILLAPYGVSMSSRAMVIISKLTISLSEKSYCVIIFRFLKSAPTIGIVTLNSNRSILLSKLRSISAELIYTGSRLSKYILLSRAIEL